MALTDKLTAIGNAIRGKTGGTAKLSLDGMVSAINGLKTTFVTQTKDVTLSETAQTIKPDSGKDGLSQVNVPGISKTYVGSSVTKQSAKTVTPTKSEQTVVASGVYTTGAVKVGAIPSEYIIPTGSETKTANGKYDVTSLAELIVNVSGGGGVPVGYSAIDLGEITISTQFTTSRQTFSHNLGVVPDVVIVMANGNVAQTYSMLMAIGGSKVNYRGGNYLNHLAYHGNSTTTVTWTNANSTSYGVSNFTATTFQLASSSSSYYWRTGTYKYIALKFS